MRLPARLGCLGWLLIGAGLLLLAPLLGGWLWYRSEADLRAVEAAPGGPPPPRAAGAEGIGPAAVVLLRLGDWYDMRTSNGYWDELHAASATIAAARMAGQDPYLPPVTSAYGWRYGLAQALGVRLAGKPVPLDPGLQGWPGAPPIPGPCAWSQVGTAVGDVVVALAGEPLGQPDEEAQLLGVDLLTTEVAKRLRSSDPRIVRLEPAEAAAMRAGLAPVLRPLRAALWRDRATLAAARYHELRRLCRAPPPVTGTGPLQTLRAHLVHRLDRADRLREARAQWTAADGATTPAELWARSVAVPAVASRAPDWLAGPWTGPRPGPSRGNPLILRLRCLLALDVLLAELDAASPAAVVPPEDPFDPPHRLRPIMRAPGPDLPPVRIGWYSVGPDGADGGGIEGVDIGFATAGKLGVGRFSDPRPSPP